MRGARPIATRSRTRPARSLARLKEEEEEKNGEKNKTSRPFEAERNDRRRSDADDSTHRTCT
eukprot:31463-Pelagococcus_subviridis.AAC.8